MQKCSSCNYKFRWAEILKSLVFCYSNLACHSCNTEYKITLPSRILTAILIALPLIIKIERKLTFSPFYLFGFYVLYIGIVLICLPFILRYKK